MEVFPDSERRQERRFNRKGVVMNIHRGIYQYKIITKITKCRTFLDSVSWTNYYRTNDYRIIDCRTN